jgi:hypothetical protein
MTEKTGTYVVTHAEAASAILRDAADSQVHTLESNPDLAPGDVVEATIEAVPPMEATWEVTAVHERRDISIERAADPPTKQERDTAADQPVGERTRIERAGTGELHVLSVPEETTERAVEEVLDDEAGLVARAARLGVNRVEVRSEEGVVSVRYLP